MRNTLAHALFALSILVTSGCVASQEQAVAPEYPSGQPDQARLDPNLFVGTWTGRGCQSDGPCWTIRVDLEADAEGRPTGTIAYPSVPCKARLEFAHWELDDVAAFRERFDNPGRCVPDGWLRLRLLDADKLGFEWSFPDGRIDAGTTLDRAR